MAFTGDVCRDFETIRQTDAGHFAQRGVGFLRRRGVHARAHAPLLRVATQVRRLFFLLHVAAAVPDELVNGRQIPLAKNLEKKCSEARETKRIVTVRSTPWSLTIRGLRARSGTVGLIGTMRFILLGGLGLLLAAPVRAQSPPPAPSASCAASSTTASSRARRWKAPRCG